MVSAVLPGLADHLVGLGAGVGEQLVGLGLGRAGQPVGGVLGQAEHLGGLDVRVPRCTGATGGCGAPYTGCDAAAGSGSGSGSGSGWYSGMACVACDATAGAGAGQLLIELGDPLTQVGVLLDEPGQLVLDQIEEGVDLVLVVAPLADRRLAERDVVDVGWCKRHCLPP